MVRTEEKNKEEILEKGARNREGKEAKEAKDAKEAKETKEVRESKETKEAKDSKEIKEAKDSKEIKEAKEHPVKEIAAGKDTKGYKEIKDPRENKEDKEEKASKDERFREEKALEEKLGRALKMVASGTPLRDGIESILRGKMGALIMVGDSPQVMAIVEGGFKIDCEFTPAYLYELAKMDGAIVLSHDARRILYANTQLVPNPLIPSWETGIRHRTAERTARQSGELVISISKRRGLITLYQGNAKYVLQDIGLLLVKANQALQTLEKYRMVLDKDLVSLSALEFENMVTVFEVARVIQRSELVMRIVKEIEGYINELGVEGRLVSMQMHELVVNVEAEILLIIQDYAVRPAEKTPRQIREYLDRWSPEELTDLVAIGRCLGYGATTGTLDLPVSARGYRILQKVPRLPTLIIENLVEHFGDLSAILRASMDDLDEVEGIGEVRARAIKNGLKRLQEQVILEQRI